MNNFEQTLRLKFESPATFCLANELRVYQAIQKNSQKTHADTESFDHCVAHPPGSPFLPFKEVPLGRKSSSVSSL